MKILAFLLALSISAPATSNSKFQQLLPMEVVFKGEEKFQHLMKHVKREN
jgi:hypothetical protein